MFVHVICEQLLHSDEKGLPLVCDVLRKQADAWKAVSKATEMTLQNMVSHKP